MRVSINHGATMALTPKQEKFAQVYVQAGNASEAYRQAYNAERMKPESIASKASVLLKQGNVSSRVNEIRAELAKRNTVTLDTLLRELEEARGVALGAETPQSSAAVAATMGKAKLLGLDKQLVEVSGSMSVNLTATQVAALNTVLDREY